MVRKPRHSPCLGWPTTWGRFRLGRAPKFSFGQTLMENHEKWMDLCALAAKEQDPAKLQAFPGEISPHLEQKEHRVKGQLSVRKEKRRQPERRTGIQICGNRKLN